MTHFGIGVTYGIKNTKISNLGNIVIFIISFFTTIISVYLGNIMEFILPNFITKYLGNFIFILIGIFICFQSFRKDNIDNNINNNNNNLNCKNATKKKTYSFFIKFLGITIKIIKDPVNSDLDKSNKIDSKEALFLGLALSLDSICIGIGSSIIGINNLIFPFIISFCQILFLSIGSLLGKKINKICNLPQNIWSITSGVLLIILGILK